MKKCVISYFRGDPMKRALCILLCFLLTGCMSAPQAGQPSTAAAFSKPDPTLSDSGALTTVPHTVPTVSQTEPTAAATEPVISGFDPNAILRTMSQEEKVGQLFLAACPSSGAVADIQAYHLGGYLLFGSDFDSETPESVLQTVASYQAASKLPLLIAVDEEGGTVCRVSSHAAFRSQRFPSPRTLYSKGGLEQVLSVEEEKCRLLAGLGINVNMAPVCDVTTDPSAFMYKRSLGESPQITGEFICAAVNLMASCQIGSVLKHFPGYGNNTDTHTGIAVDSRPLQTLTENDLVPFRAGIEAGCGAVLVSHTIVECLDGEYPASLSPAVHSYLREEMGFAGVIVTDDLTMDAITDLYGSGEAAVLAVLAGNDLLCTFDYRTQYEAVLQALRGGRIPQELVDQAVCRILQWKYDLGLLENLTDYT